MVIANTAKGIQTAISGVVDNVVTFIREKIQQLIDFIPDPIKKLLGGLELPSLDLDIKLPEFTNPFEGLLEKANELKDAVVDFSGVEKTITDENNKQLDAKNKIVETNGKIKTSVDEITPAEKEAREEAEKLKETFKGIGESVRSDLVGGLKDAINGSKSFGDAISGVLNNLKNKLLDIALNKAISGIGGLLSGGKGFTGFLGGLFGKKEMGGRVNAGGAFLVGERGPEILQMGSKGGNIIPNNKIGGGNTNNVVVNVNVEGGIDAQGEEEDSRQLGSLIAIAVQNEIVKQQRPNGLLSR